MKNVFLFLCMSILTFTSCEKEEKTTVVDNCASFTKLATTSTLNGSNLKLSAAVFSASQGVFAFQYSTITDDCLEQNAVQINITFPTTPANISGTYPVKDFFDAEDKEAFGAITKSKFNPISVVNDNLKSGTLKITDHGSKDYTIDLNGKTETGSNVTFKVRHKF